MVALELSIVSHNPALPGGVCPVVMENLEDNRATETNSGLRQIPCNHAILILIPAGNISSIQRWKVALGQFWGICTSLEYLNFMVLYTSTLLHFWLTALAGLLPPLALCYQTFLSHPTFPVYLHFELSKRKKYGVKQSSVSACCFWQEDVFTVTAVDLGPLKKLRIRHNNTHSHSSWYLDRVEIVDTKDDTT